MPDEPNTPEPNATPEPQSPEQMPITVPGGFAPWVRPSIDLRDTDQPMWTGWDIILVPLITLLLVFVLNMVGIVAVIGLNLLPGLSAVELAKEPKLIIPVQTLAYVIVFGVIVLLVKRGERVSFWRAIRWNWPVRWLYGFGAGMALTLIIPILSKVLTIPKKLPIDEMMNSTANAYVLAVFGILIAPFLEEIFFRGMLYPLACERAATAIGAVSCEILLLLPTLIKRPRSGWLVLVLALVAFDVWLIVVRVTGRHKQWFRAANPTRVGKSIGIGITAFGFAMIHGSQLASAWAPLVILMVVGLALTAVRAKTGSVATSFLMHVGYNFTLFTALWIHTDQFRHMEKAAGVFIFRP